MTMALSIAELEARLDDALDAVLTSQRRSTPLAAPLAGFARADQERVLAWTDAIAKSNAELAYRFVRTAPSALAVLSADDLEAWVVQAMDTYDRLGLNPACAAIDDVEAFTRAANERIRSVRLEEAARVLELFLRGLSGRHLALRSGETTYTDTETLYLPARVAHFPEREINFRLYKALAAHLWAQTRYGTFRAPLRERLAGYPDPNKALRLFHALETIRLDACLARDLPGLHREMMSLRDDGHTYPETWQPHVHRLQAADADVADTLTSVSALYAEPLPAPACYQGSLLLEPVEKTAAARKDREKLQFQGALARLLARQAENAGDAMRRKAVRAHARTGSDDNGGGFELTLDGQALPVPDDMRALMGSIAQDLGGIPDEYLAAVDAHHAPGAGAQRSEDAGAHEGGIPYDEWDYRRGHYRKAWCSVREIDVAPTDEPFVADTLRKYAGLAARLRKTFEALRRDQHVQRRQMHGDDIDIDALVEARVDLRGGRELSERVFVKTRRIARDIAVVFMVDMSGSTKGWINEAERESLVLLCEALEILGDRYAIYGFSGITHKRCEIYRVKRFDEPYAETVKRRIAGMRPQDYTRMGAAIRHLGVVAANIEARTKLLVTLSDGRPDDYDGYRGDYGIEDTRKALFEIKRAGIHPFCITIDTAARDYLPHMYGAANYTVIDDVRKLPYRVSDIYRRLTA